jgi:hypothetical protein
LGALVAIQRGSPEIFKLGHRWKKTSVFSVLLWKFHLIQ